MWREEECLQILESVLETNKDAVVRAYPGSNILKSHFDTRLYQGLTLPNRLQVLLISDETADKSAAALSVCVGSWSDPEGVAGLAHFLEHMLFLGTEKFPDENEYSNFLNSHGGRSNAFTGSEETNFHFDCNPDALEGALDRFAQFFVAPLFTAESTLREMNAVDSEHAKNLQSDGWRLQEVHKHTSNPLHPTSRFGTGNLQTLQHGPKAAGVDIRAELLRFHARYYSANLMKLVVLGKEDLGTLQQWVTRLFAPVRCDASLNRPQWAVPPFAPEQLCTRLHYVPVKDSRLVDLHFLLPSQLQHYRTHPLHYIAHMLGHESAGSVLSALKTRGWARELLAGPGTEAMQFSVFVCTLELTPDGLAHVDEVVQLCFAYLELVRQQGVQEWIFDECKSLDDLKFRFKDKEPPMAYVLQLAGNLHRYPQPLVLCGPHLSGRFDAELIRSQLGYLTPRFVRVAISSQQFASDATAVEPFYGSRYRIAPLPASLLALWSAPPAVADLHVPARNPFIPRDLTVAELPPSPPAVPQLLENTELLRLWHKQDDTFRRPRTNLHIELCSPAAYASPRNAVLTRLFCRVLEDNLSELAYQAELAGLKYSIANSIPGLQLVLRGYNDKQRVLLERILAQFRALVVQPARFEVLKEAAYREYKNFRLELPYAHAVYNAACCLQQLRWSNDEYVAVFEDAATGPSLTASHLSAFVQQLLLEAACLDVLVHGNCTAADARSLGQLLLQTLQCAPVPPLAVTQQRAVVLKRRVPCYLPRAGPNPDNVNCAVENDYQIGFEAVHSSALLELFAQITSDLSFHQLRTTEQLGYIVFSGVRRHLAVQYFRVVVQSSTRSPEYLDDRIEAFIETLRDVLRSMPADVFAQHVRALIAKKLEKDKSLTQESQRYWDEVQLKLHRFENAKSEAKALEKITQDELLAFYETHIAKTAAKRRKLSSMIFGKGHSVPATFENGEVIRDIVEFKRGRKLFGLL